MEFRPTGEEREVKRTGSVTLAGAPLTYVVTLVAVVAALARVPLSVALGFGKSFPMSQSVYPLVGWLLGPLAGAVADGLGALLGVFVAPHTSILPAATVASATVGGLAAGAMGWQGKRRLWATLLAVALLLLYLVYGGWAIVRNGISPAAFLLGTVINWTALLLYILPTRTWLARRIADEHVRDVAIGLFLGTWVVAGISHFVAGALVYFALGWPEPVWWGMASAAPFEHLIRCAVGATIGTGVIAGVRAIGLVRAENAVY